MKPIDSRRFALALSSTLLGLSLPLLAAPGDILFATEFNTDGDAEGWVDSGDKMKAFGWDGTTITGEEDVAGGVFRAKVTQGTNNDAQLVRTPFSPTIDANLIGSMQIRIRQSSDDGATWKTAGALNGFLSRLNPGNFNPDGTIIQTPDETVTGDGWTIVTYNLDGYANQGLNNVRFDPSGTTDESFEIDYIRLLETLNPRPVTEINPESAIPAEFDLVREWNAPPEFGELTVNNFTSSFTGVSSLGGPEQSLFGVNSSNGDPQFVTPSALDIAVFGSSQLIIEVAFIPSTASTMDRAELFWSDGSGGFAGIRRLSFATEGLASGVRHVIRATFVDDINTQLNQLRFDPLNSAGKDFELDYIRIYTDGSNPEEVGLAWDPDTSTSGAQGGNGTWNTTDSFWLDETSTNVAWPSPPISNDNAIFGATAGTVTIGSGGISVHNMTFETSGYEITGGDLIFEDSFSTAKISVLAGQSSTISSAIVSNDSNLRKINPGSLILANDTTVNSFAVAGGAVTINAGTTLNTLGSNPTESDFGLKLTGSSTVLNIDGTVNVEAGFFGGFSNDADFELNLNPGGSLTTPSNAYLGWNASVTYNFNGGTSSIGGDLIHLDSGAGIANFSAGVHDIAGFMGVRTNGNDSHSVITIDGGTVSADTVGHSAGDIAGAPLGTNSFTLNLNGGSLETNRIFLNRGPATSPGDISFNLRLNGGTIIASSAGASPTLIDENLGNEFLGTIAFNITVEENGVTFDTNGSNKSIDQPMLVGTITGGTVTKTGAGNLNRDNDYDGETIVEQGGLGGTGFVEGDVTVSAGAGLAYFITDPVAPSNPLFVGGIVTVPDPLVISIDSGDAAFPETAASGIVMLSASLIEGFNPATVQFDLTSFTGNGTWSVEENNSELILAYTPGVGGYSTWAGTNADGQTSDMDFDNDGVSNGVEYFMGETGSSFTPNPAIVNGTITWPKDPAFVGSFKVQVSDNLKDWTDIVPPDASINESNPDEVIFTVPEGDPKRFARLVVEVTE